MKSLQAGEEIGPPQPKKRWQVEASDDKEDNSSADEDSESGYDADRDQIISPMDDDKDQSVARILVEEAIERENQQSIEEVDSKPGDRT